MSEGNGGRGVATHQSVVAPEQVRLDLALAGPSARMLAYAVDWVVLAFVQLALFALMLAVVAGGGAVAEALGEWLGPVGDGGDQDEVVPVVLLFVLAVFLFQLVVENVYFVSCELAWGGRSVGKRVVGLRVVRDDGLPIGLRESLLRNLLRVVDALPTSYLVGLVAVVATERAQRLGDLVAGTIVVRLDREPPPLRIEDDGEDLSRFRFSREQLEAIGPDELRLARQTLRRLPSLDEDRKRAALARACDALADRMRAAKVDETDRAAFLRAVVRARTRG
ncbi:MAG: RDD family protein [Myxococcota bacterium]|nr:RDD family protein [Myxococcales bacterium]